SGEHTDSFQPPDDNAKELFRSTGGLGSISDCKTVYSWPVNKDDLVSEAIQKVSVEIDSKVLWDIDYVALILRRSARKLKPGVERAIWTLIGIAAGVAGTLLSKLLTR
ncbi:MAG: hypothetical protein ACREDR_25535, partial [Blastocatellia bacterium]